MGTSFKLDTPYSISGKKNDKDDAEQLSEPVLRSESFESDADLIDQEAEAELNPMMGDGAEHDIGRMGEGSYFHSGHLSVVRSFESDRGSRFETSAHFWLSMEKN